MQPTDLIRRVLGSDGWALARTAWAESSIVERDDSLCILPSFKVFRVKGATGQFDFPMLPHCSYGYFAANGREAFGLTRENKEIERLLENDWHSLIDLSAVALAELILPFYDQGIKQSHHVLSDIHDLKRMCERGHFEIDSDQFSRIAHSDVKTTCEAKGNSISIRALTLLGWMHTKSNLGIETLSIAQDGHVSFAVREVLSERIFRSVPAIMY